MSDSCRRVIDKSYTQKMETYLYLEEEREAEDMVGFIRDDRMDEE